MAKTTHPPLSYSRPTYNSILLL